MAVTQPNFTLFQRICQIRIILKGTRGGSRVRPTKPPLRLGGQRRLALGARWGYNRGNVDAPHAHKPLDADQAGKQKKEDVVTECRNTKISRRTFLKRSAILGGALITGGAGYRAYYRHAGRNLQPGRAKAYLDTIQPDGHPEALPNILVILADDLGYGDLESPALNTPNLERMAAAGTRLTSFYASASVCTPSRAGLLTGRYPVRTHMTNPLFSTHDAMNLLMDVLGRYAYGVTGIPQDEVLLPEVLSRRGYRTGLVGKWHLGGRPGYLPNDRGFDSFYGALWSNDDQPYAIYRGREIVVEAPADQNVLTRDFTREAQAFIRTHKDDPFFLYLAHAMPHIPIHASDGFRGRSAGGLYGDAVEELDWSVGQILDTLDRLDLAGKTLVIFTSDNGPWWQGNPGYARGRKLLTFEGGFRVPFIATWPGVVPRGKSTAEMSMNFDLFPTCLQLAGATLPQDRIIDGRDMMPILRGEAASSHDTLLFYDTRTLVALRYQRWKYHRRFRTDNAAFWPLVQGPFLFDLDRDPNESYSLVESEPEVAANLSAMLEARDAEMAANLRGWL
jgi:arylsulfatase A